MPLEPDPTDPVKKTKKVTRGKTTTTTSTRRGENERGRLGTFTDTTNTTPITTDTTGEGGGSIPFQKAFANAKAEGLPTFTFGENEYTTDMKDSSTSNEISTNSTFKPDLEKPLPPIEAHGIKFSKQSYEMGETQDIQPPAEKPKDSRPPLYHVGGTNAHNMRFGGSTTTMITSDETIQPDISYRLSPGDISKDSPISGERNIAIKRKLNPKETAAAYTKYGGGWHRPIPEKMADKMIAKEAADDKVIEARNLNTHNKILANKERVETNRANKAAERNEVIAQQKATMQAKIDAKAKKEAEKEALRQKVRDARV